jgi:hypothetical protein
LGSLRPGFDLRRSLRAQARGRPADIRNEVGAQLNKVVAQLNKVAGREGVPAEFIRFADVFRRNWMTSGRRKPGLPTATLTLDSGDRSYVPVPAGLTEELGRIARLTFPAQPWYRFCHDSWSVSRATCCFIEGD